MSTTVEKLRPAMVYRSMLKSGYSLTNSLIAELGEPDKQVRNPHYRSDRPGPIGRTISEIVQLWGCRRAGKPGQEL